MDSQGSGTQPRLRVGALAHRNGLLQTAARATRRPTWRQAGDHPREACRRARGDAESLGYAGAVHVCPARIHQCYDEHTGNQARIPPAVRRHGLTGDQGGAGRITRHEDTRRDSRGEGSQDVHDWDRHDQNQTLQCGLHTRIEAKQRQGSLQAASIEVAESGDSDAQNGCEPRAAS